MSAAIEECVTLGEREVALWRVGSGDRRPIEGVLARYLAVEPQSVTLGRSALGKPQLPGAAFEVSLAHSGDVALVAVARDREVGVDVERIRPGADRWSLVNHALTPRERLQLEQVPRASRSKAFLSMWARKEALLKAAGVGLGVDPALVELDLTSVRAVPLELGSAQDWTVVDVQLEGHVAAVAARGSVSELRLYDARRRA
jgi:4'-phosphopantetheinyl transferase